MKFKRVVALILFLFKYISVTAQRSVNFEHISIGSGGWSNPKKKDPETQKLPPVQLHNIKTDIAEQQNVYAEHPEIVAELKALLVKQIKAGRTTPGALQKN